MQQNALFILLIYESERGFIMYTYKCRVCDEGIVKENGDVYTCDSCGCIYTEYHINKMNPIEEDAPKKVFDVSADPDILYCENIYLSAVDAVKKSRDENTLIWSANRFAMIPGYKDSAELRDKCLKAAEIKRKDELYFKAIHLISQELIPSLREAREILFKIKGFRNADELIIECENDILYFASKSLINSPDYRNFESAIKNFESLGNWRDSEEIVKRYRVSAMIV